VLAVGIAVVVLCAHVNADVDSIGDQDGVYRVSFDNGLACVVVEAEQAGQADQAHDLGDAQAWLMVRAGSLYETDTQRGSAMVLERLIRMGIEGYSAEAIDGLLIDEPTGYGGHGGSFVAFDQVGFMGAFGHGEQEKDQLGRLLGFYARVLDVDSLMLTDERIGEAIAWVRESMEHEQSVDLRARRVWLPELMEGTPFGERLPGASFEAIDRLKPDDVRAFARAVYHPAQAVLIVVGDVDAAEIERLVRGSVGAVDSGAGRGWVADGRSHRDVSGRVVVGSDPGFTRHQAAMVWFEDQGLQDFGMGGLPTGDVSERIRGLIVDRVAGEAVRYRLGRLGRQELGPGYDLVLDQVEMWGQLGLTQVVVVGDGDAWESSIEFLVRQNGRISRDGLGDAEIARARRLVLTRWHRDAGDWATTPYRRRVGLVHWLVTSGRPILGSPAWDALATEIMSSVTDREINDAARKMVEPKHAGYIALMDHKGAGDTNDALLGVVDAAKGQALGAIDPEWMTKLSGSMIDGEPREREVLEVSQHPESGSWTAVYENGVRVHARAMGDGGENEEGSGGVYLAATIWGNGLFGAGVDDDLVQAALVAWRSPTTETRGGGAVSVFIEEHGLRVSAYQDVGFVQLRVSGDGDEFEAAVELMYALLGQPMIEQGAFDAWAQRSAGVRASSVDQAIKAMYGVRAGGQSEAKARVTIDEAQRLITQMVRKGRLEIAIAGETGFDAPGMIEHAGAYFGSLVSRAGGEAVGAELESMPDDGVERAVLVKHEKMLRVRTKDEQEYGFVIGYFGVGVDELRAMRSMSLSSMMLNSRFAKEGEARGFGGKIRAQIAFSDLFDGEAVFLIRVLCDPGEIALGDEVIDSVIGGVLMDGFGEDELRRTQDLVDESIARYFDTVEYWSQRLSVLGVKRRTVDELWGIREGYRGIDAGYASGVIARVVEGEERFRIELVESKLVD
tara:strand:- start:51562 stop:54432 length:2871 start_codon:yes stop_codon:yes gene_type:complete